MKEEIRILNTPTVAARALYHNDRSVEILIGTTMKPYGQQEMKSMRMLYQKLLKSGVIEEKPDGHSVFVKSYRFHDPNTAAQFLMHRGGNNSSAWKKESSDGAEKKNAKASASNRMTVRKKQVGKSQKQKKKKLSQQKRTNSEQVNVSKPAEKAKRKNAPVHQTKRKQNTKTAQHRNYKRRVTMADKMHMTPQKGSSSLRKDTRSSTGLLTDLYTFRH